MRRRHDNTIFNGDSKEIQEGEKTKDEEFLQRDSPLTILIEHSLHIKALYHIFIAILLVLLCDTVAFDFLESGRINIGLTSVINGFHGIGRSAALWLFEFLVALSLYPGLLIYKEGRKLIKENSALCRVWSVAGVVGVVAIEAVLLVVTIWQLATNYHALASTVALSCEMFRFAMKTWAVAASCAPRCQHGSTPLPTFKHYVYFLFAPTLIYRDHYPRTKNIRWKFVISHFMEVVALVFYNSFLFERFILPYWSDYGKQPQIEASTLVRGMFACVLPGLLSFLSGFYCLLHAWLNAFAEMLTFADRLFYEDWWTSSQFSRFYRAWNRVVHSWLRDYIYRPLAPRAGRVISTLAVFIISALAHEVVLALSFGFFYPVLIIEFGIIGILLIPATAIGKRYPHFFNMLLWLSFFIGNGIFWSLYPMEYYARKNCPPSENDSFFVPKSWSCPEIVLKKNWTFQNPLQ